MEGGGEEVMLPVHDPDFSTVGSPEETIMVPHPGSPPRDSDELPPSTTETSVLTDELRENTIKQETDEPPLLPTTKTAILTDELRDKIIRQVEYYLSDENLRTDKFLLKYLAKDEEGYVPIAVIASFNKMKKLTHHKSLVVAAMKESSLLTLSSDEKKVKRVHPFPLTEVLDPELCTVLVENLPKDHSIENMKKIFGESGIIKKLTVHEENATREPRKCSIEEKLLSGKLHAVVEYETVEAAEKAAATLNNEHDWRHGMRVKLLKRRGKSVQKKKGHDSEKKSHVQADLVVDKDNQQSSDLNDDAPYEEHELNNGEQQSKEKNGNKGQNRRRSRKHKYQGASAAGGMGHGTLVHEVPKPPPGPRMPDGTRGFTMGRGRPLVEISQIGIHP